MSTRREPTRSTSQPPSTVPAASRAEARVAAKAVKAAEPERCNKRRGMVTWRELLATWAPKVPLCRALRRGAGDAEGGARRESRKERNSPERRPVGAAAATGAFS